MALNWRDRSQTCSPTTLERGSKAEGSGDGDFRHDLSLTESTVTTGTCFAETNCNCSFFMLNVPVNNFSVMLGQSLCFLVHPGYNQYFRGVTMSCSRTQHVAPCWARTLDLLIRSLRCLPPEHRDPYINI